MSDAPKVWVGCLGCYNAGHLTGYWIDAVDAPETTEEWVTEVRRRGQTVADPGIYDLHEELWCFDYEGFSGFLSGEFSPHTGRQVAEVIAAIDAAGLPVDAVGGWAEQEGRKITEWDAPTSDDFSDAFRGEHESFRDFCREQVEELGWGGFERVPEGLAPYLDYDLIERELDMSHYTVETDGGVYVFASL